MVEVDCTSKVRGDLGYGWFVADRIRPLQEAIDFYKQKINCYHVPANDVVVFKLALRKAATQLAHWYIERDYCEANRKIAYSLRG